MATAETSVSNLVTFREKNGDLAADELLASEINRVIAAVNTNATNITSNTSSISTINSKLTGLSDVVTISIVTLTVEAINTALLSVMSQQNTTINALKA
jgi:hypothetical protein